MPSVPGWRWPPTPRRPGRRLDRLRLGRLPALLPQRQRRLAPRRLADEDVLARLVEHADELELPLNLGGGIRPGDALEEFKRGYANRRLAWRTSEVVCDPERYAALGGDREAGGYFPAYRA